MSLTDYNVVSSGNTETLVDKVKAAGADGWLPTGAAFATPDGQFHQTMVKGDVAGGGGGGGGGEVTAADITDATETGRNVLTAEDADAARTAIGAGTSNLQLGTTAGTALAGNTSIPAAPTWANISGKPAVVAAGADAATARSAIGAGTPYTLPAAGAAIGGVKIGAAVADATDAEDVVAQVNALLASLRASGAIAS